MPAAGLQCLVRLPGLGRIDHDVHAVSDRVAHCHHAAEFALRCRFARTFIADAANSSSDRLYQRLSPA